MEGRSPPPPAEHPFPDDPTPINKKFWGTIASRAFFKYLGATTAAFFGLVGLNYLVTRHETKLFGISIPMTPEEMQKRKDIFESHSKMNHFVAPIHYNFMNFTPDKNAAQGVDLRFDDGVRLSPAYEDKTVHPKVR